MCRSQLHDVVDEYYQDTTKVRERIIAHAMVDLGLLTSWECSYETCLSSSRAFTPIGSGRKWIASLDHVVARADGGTERPENIQFLHSSCNSSKGMIYTDERRKKISDRAKQMWADPEFRASNKRGWTQRTKTPEETQRRSAAKKSYWETAPAQPTAPCSTCGKQLRRVDEPRHQCK